MNPTDRELLPEWTKMDDLGGRMPSDVRVAIRNAYHQGREDGRAVVGWQPIETAPKDGSTVILGFAGSHSEEGFWMNDPERNHWGEIGWFSSDADVLCERPASPTHWMPLPSPPAALEAQ